MKLCCVLIVLFIVSTFGGKQVSKVCNDAATIYIKYDKNNNPINPVRQWTSFKIVTDEKKSLLNIAKESTCRSTTSFIGDCAIVAISNYLDTLIKDYPPTSYSSKDLGKGVTLHLKLGTKRPFIDLLKVVKNCPQALFRNEGSQVPTNWTCDPTFYNASDGCDCNCGAYDPDCDDPNADIFNCTKGTNPKCNLPFGTCSYDQVVPDSWICNVDFYNASDGCDCNCGFYDPDCDRDIFPVFNCPKNSSCLKNGTCSIQIPAEWVCKPNRYGSGDNCDCNCGASDPDCLDNTLKISNCPCQNMSCQYGFCAGGCNGYTVSILKNESKSNELPVVTIAISTSVAFVALCILVIVFIRFRANNKNNSELQQNLLNTN